MWVICASKNSWNLCTEVSTCEFTLLWQSSLQCTNKPHWPIFTTKHRFPTCSAQQLWELSWSFLSCGCWDGPACQTSFHTLHTQEDSLCSSLSCFVLRVSPHQGRVHTRRSSLSHNVFFPYVYQTWLMIDIVWTESSGVPFNSFQFNYILTVTVPYFLTAWFCLIPTHNNLLIQPWPSSCWPAHRMGIYSNPLINGLIPQTFKINFVFVEKFPVIP